MRPSLRRLGAVLIALSAACRPSPDRSEIGAPSSAPASLPNIEALEKAHHEAMKHALPRCGPGVKGVCEMVTESEIGHLDGERVTARGDALPPPLHGHGEALRAAWVAEDGAELLAGYMYTGVDGPDTGVVYRRDPGGKWAIVYTKPANPLSHVWGRSSSDVWAAGGTTLAHWDGKAWKEEAIPVREGYLSGVWGSDSELYVVGGDSSRKGDGGRIYRRDAAGTWSVDGRAPRLLNAIHGNAAVVIAVGDGGGILRRRGAGQWIEEHGPERQNRSVFVAGEHDLYVARSGLLRSTGDGRWTLVELASHAQVTTVWGRSATDVYAGTLQGVFHLRGTSWVATEWTHEGGAIAGNTAEVLVANQH